MLKTRLLHPEILAALGEAGHGAQVLIADGNYPLATRSNPDAYRVFLNLEPGKLTVTDVLSVIADAIPVEAAYVMGPDDGSEPSIYEDFRAPAAGQRARAPRAGSSSTTWPAGRTPRWRSPRASSGSTPTSCSRSAW